MRNLLLALIVITTIRGFADTPPPIYSFQSPLTASGNNISVQAASGSQNGYFALGDYSLLHSLVGLPSMSGQNGKFLTTDGTNASWSTVSANYTFLDSIVNNSGTITLVGDSASPGNSQYYGTNGSGSLGYYSLPTSAIWGAITGTLSNQTDLQTALNGKQATGNYVTALTGDVSASGPGSANTTISNWVNYVYVDFVTGNDSTGTGSPYRPWKTLQHTFNSISPSINVPFIIHVAGGNNDTDTYPITGKTNTNIIADYPIQVHGINYPDDTTNDTIAFTNIVFLEAVNWTRNSIYSINVSFINTEFFSGPIIEQNGSGQSAVTAQNSLFLNSSWRLSSVGIFYNCTFYGTSNFMDVPSTYSPYLQFQGSYNDGAMSIAGAVDPAYFSGFIQDTTFGASLTFTTTGNGTPTVETDSAGLTPTWAGSPNITYLSQSKNEAYSPSTPSLWPTPPTTVAGALDYIASTEIQSIIKKNTSGYVLYISNDVGSDSTGDGSFAKPFQTISKGITVATAIPSTVDTPVVIKVMPGQYTENLSFTQQGITLEAMSNDYHSWPVFVYGNISINLTGTAGGGDFGAQDNNVTINGFELISTNSSPVITFSGSVFQRLFLNHCFVYNSGSGTSITASNTGTNSGTASTVTVRDTDFKSTSGTTVSMSAGNMYVSGANPGVTQGTSGNAAASNSGSGALTFANASISGEVVNSSTGSIQTNNTTIAAASGTALSNSSTGSVTVAQTTMTASTSGAVVTNTSTGAITFESCVVTNNISTGQGLTDAGGTITSANVIWTIGTGSGSYVAKGTGIFAYAFNIFTSQTKLQNTLTIVALTTTPTTGP